MMDNNYARKRFWYAMTLVVLLFIIIIFLKDSERSRKNMERKLLVEQRQQALANLRKDFSFDILIFTQHWPVTVCSDWIERHKKNECVLPKAKNSWSIHGIWPTKYHQIGPLFCNSTWEFDIKEIAPIEDEMKEKWINIEKGTPLDSLWSHEWEKHGTCAAEKLNNLNTQFKYFQTGLNLFDEYSISKLLQSSYIKPGMNYHLDEIHSVLNRSIGNNFAIVCEKDRETKEQVLFEIRICFDKDLKLHSCDGIVMKGSEFKKSDEIITNCNKNEEISYPSTSSVLHKQWMNKYNEQNAQNSTWMNNVINVYKLLRLLQWVTL